MTRVRVLLRGAVSDDEYREAKRTWDCFIEEAAAQTAAVRQAQAELQAALTVLKLHEVRASRRGVIRRFCKYGGEAVDNREPVLEIEPQEGP